MIPALNRGEAVAVSAGGEPPALLTSTSSRAVTVDDLVDQRGDAVGVAHVRGDELDARRERLGLVPSAHDDARTVGRRTARRCRVRSPGCRR